MDTYFFIPIKNKKYTNYTRILLNLVGYYSIIRLSDQSEGGKLSMPSNAEEIENFIVIILVVAIPIVAFTICMIYTQQRKRKRFYDDYRKILLENEKMGYYLKYKISDDSLVRYQNNMAYFKNSNFDSEYFEQRLLQEISKLRKEVKSISDLKFKLENNIDNGNSSFDYQEFIFKLSSMTNIQFLFEMLNNDKQDEIVYIKNVLADIVHTIRNPVSGVRAIITIMKMEDSLDDHTRKSIADIELCLDQIEDNLNSYYQVSHMNPFSDENNEKINLKKELENRLQVVTIASGKKVNIQGSIDDFELDKRISEVLILAITCILENAIEFCPDNGTIYLETQRDNSQIQITIQNNGPIIDTTVINKIFDLGFSTRKSSGRGLAIAKRAVEELLNGIIVCENLEENAGVKFIILIEAEEADE